MGAWGLQCLEHCYLTQSRESPQHPQAPPSFGIAGQTGPPKRSSPTGLNLPVTVTPHLSSSSTLAPSLLQWPRGGPACPHRPQESSPSPPGLAQPQLRCPGARRGGRGGGRSAPSPLPRTASAAHGGEWRGRGLRTPRGSLKDHPKAGTSSMVVGRPRGRWSRGRGGYRGFPPNWVPPERRGVLRGHTQRKVPPGGGLSGAPGKMRRGGGGSAAAGGVRGLVPCRRVYLPGPSVFPGAVPALPGSSRPRRLLPAQGRAASAAAALQRNPGAPAGSARRSAGLRGGTGIGGHRVGHRQQPPPGPPRHLRASLPPTPGTLPHAAPEDTALVPHAAGVWGRGVLCCAGRGWGGSGSTGRDWGTRSTGCIWGSWGTGSAGSPGGTGSTGSSGGTSALLRCTPDREAGISHCGRPGGMPHTAMWP